MEFFLCFFLKVYFLQNHVHLFRLNFEQLLARWLILDKSLPQWKYKSQANLANSWLPSYWKLGAVSVSLQTHHVDSTLKRRGNDRGIHVVKLILKTRSFITIYLVDWLLRHKDYSEEKEQFFKRLFSIGVLKNYRDPELIMCKLYARYNNLAGIAFHRSKRLSVSYYCGYTRIKETLNVIFSLSYKKVFSKKAANLQGNNHAEERFIICFPNHYVILQVLGHISNCLMFEIQRLLCPNWQ